nr:FUSC family protein [Motilibacter aurantiacus]
MRAAADELRRGGQAPVVEPLPAEAVELAGWSVEAVYAAGRAPSRRAQLLGLARRPAALLEPAALRVLVAVTLAGLLAQAVGLGQTYWAAVAAVAALQAPNAAAAVARGVQRSIGTAVGVVGAGLLLAVEPGPAATVASIVVLQLLAELYVARNYALAMLFITPLSLLLTEVGRHTGTGQLVRDRLLDTLLGAGVAIACTLALTDRHAVPGLGSALSACEEAYARAAVPEPAHADVERLAQRLLELRTAYDRAAGEPVGDDLPAEQVLDLERRGHELLAAYASGRPD